MKKTIIAIGLFAGSAGFAFAITAPIGLHSQETVTSTAYRKISPALVQETEKGTFVRVTTISVSDLSDQLHALHAQYQALQAKQATVNNAQ